MSTVQLVGGILAVRLTRFERVGGLLGDLDVPLAAVVSSVAVPDGLRAARGLRAPGLALPGRVKVGTWRGRAGRSYVAVRRGPALRLRLRGFRYDTVLVSTPDAERLAAAVRPSKPGPDAEPIAPGTREVTFTSGPLTLVGTLTVPARQPRGAVLLLAGSGPIDRDGNHRRLRLDIQAQLARALDDAGYATLRYDRRGVGASDGEFLRAGLRDNLDDAKAALAALRAETGLEPRRTFLVGHSEGALLAASVAAAEHDLGGLVLLSCPARTGEQTLRWQAERIPATLPPAVRALLRLLRVDLAAKVRKNHAKLRATTTPVARVGGVSVNALWFREFLDYDPRPDLARTTAPVLAVTGSKDLQTPPEDVVAIASAAAGPVETVVVDDVSHILRSQSGALTLRSYRKDVRRPVDQRLAQLVLRWLDQRTDARNP
ncbi:MAG TPA: alpha/beta hydrolase [Actinomycetales bacterium]|nr:alpha/beta hydrolase [Actinomycetales bacterium]